MASTSLRFIPLPENPPDWTQREWQSVKMAIEDGLLRELRGVEQYARETTAGRHDSIYTGLSGAAYANPPLCWKSR
jgi:hypothetical protein